MSDIINFGDSRIRHPETGNYVWPWTINVIENAIAETLTFQITGIPDPTPNVGEEFYLYIRIPL